MAEDFQLRNAIFPPLFSEFLMLGFYEVGRGAFSCCLRRTPISVFIHYLWCISTHRPRNTHSPQFYFLLLTHKYFRVADISTAVSPRDLCVSCSPNLWPLPLHPKHHSVNPVPLSSAGQQGSWGCRRPRLLFRAAEADMGRQVSDGIGRLSLIDFTSHILLCHNHHWLRIKYVYCLITIWQEQSVRETQ